MENIFISHIHEEAPLAKALKEELEATTVGQWQVFVSSDSANITLGDQWFSKIDAALGEHRLLLALCSPASMQRLWIGYEVGYAAAKGVPIIPICHSGLKVDALPSFLSRYQGISIDAPGFVTQLFGAIQKHIPLPRSPRISEQEIAKAIQEALAEIHAVAASISEPEAILDEVEPESEDCIIVLKHLARASTGSLQLRELSTYSNLPGVRVQYAVDILSKHGLVTVQPSMNGNPMYHLVKEGRAYVVKKGYAK